MVTSSAKDNRYVPDRGDLIWFEFNPQSGHEQAGRRPALVISPKSYNKAAGLVLVCPITSKAKGYPFEVVVPSNKKIAGVILSDQIKNLDWRARKAKFISRTPPEAIDEVLLKLRVLL